MSSTAAEFCKRLTHRRDYSCFLKTTPGSALVAAADVGEASLPRDRLNGGSKSAKRRGDVHRWIIPVQKLSPGTRIIRVVEKNAAAATFFGVMPDSSWNDGCSRGPSHYDQPATRDYALCKIGTGPRRKAQWKTFHRPEVSCCTSTHARVGCGSFTASR